MNLKPNQKPKYHSNLRELILLIGISMSLLTAVPHNANADIPSGLSAQSLGNVHYSNIIAMNDSGHVVGFTGSSFTNYRIFFWDGSFHDIGLPANTTVDTYHACQPPGLGNYYFQGGPAKDIINNKDELLIECWFSPNSNPSYWGTRGFVWHNGVFTPISNMHVGGLNDLGVVAGYKLITTPNYRVEPQVRLPNGLEFPIGNFVGNNEEAVAYGITKFGSTFGVQRFEGDNFNDNTFVMHFGVLNVIDHPVDANRPIRPVDMNSNGQLVGNYSVGNFGNKIFLWSAGQLRHLDTLMGNAGGTPYERVAGITEAGEILASDSTGLYYVDTASNTSVQVRNLVPPCVNEGDICNPGYGIAINNQRQILATACRRILIEDDGEVYAECDQENTVYLFTPTSPDTDVPNNAVLEKQAVEAPAVVTQLKRNK